jgi:CBS domain-containing protein
MGVVTEPAPDAFAYAVLPVRVADATGHPLPRLMRPVVWCEATDRVREVAGRVSAEGSSSAIVRTAGGIGIVTDHDFRQRVGTGEVSVDASIVDITTTPVVTIEEEASRATAYLRMLERGVHHLVVTDRAGRPVGVLRVGDVVQVEARDPILIRSAIDAAETVAALAEACQALPAMLVELVHNRVLGSHIGAVHTAVVDAVISRMLAFHGAAPAGVPTSWVLLGSLARGEPLPRSDLDTALVWSDPPADRPDPADEIRAWADDVLNDLERCGLVRCASGANAPNPLFSRSRSSWLGTARDWLHDPTGSGALLLSAMVADSRPLTEPDLGRSLTDVVCSHTRTDQFLRALLDEALAWRPPLGVVRDFVVHHSGEHRGQFDLKRGGLAPLVALGRWIAIVVGDTRGNTPDRLRRGAEAGLLTADEAHMLVTAFEGIYALVLDQEVSALQQHATPTTYLSPRKLDSLTRAHLHESFRAIGQIQTTVDQHWRYRLSR